MFKIRVANRDPNHEEEDYNQRRVNPLHSAIIKLKVGECIFEIFLNQDLRNEVPRDHEEHVYTNESASEKIRPGMEYNDYTNCDSSEPIYVRPIVS